MSNQEGSVLAAIDLTAASDQAITQAHLWAERDGSALVVCHVLPDAGPLKSVMSLVDSLQLNPLDEQHDTVRGELHGRIRRLTGRSPKEYKLVVQRGSPHAVILRLAEEQEATLVVVAASEKSTLERLVLGSSAEQVVRHARSHVLVARPSPDSGVVLAATDLSDAALPAVEMAVAEAARRSAEVAAVHCVNVQQRIIGTVEPAFVLDKETLAALREAASNTLQASVARFGGEGRTIVVDGDPKRVLAEVTRDNDAQLLVVGTHGRTGLLRLALGSVAIAAARTAPCSVLIARHR